VETRQTEIKMGTGAEQLEQAAVELRELGDQIRGDGKQKEVDEKPRAWDVDCGTEAVKQLRQLADAVKSNAVEQRALLLGSIEALLAGADVLSCDCVAALQAERDVMQGGMQSQQLEAESGEGEAAYTPALSFGECEPVLKSVEEILDRWQPDMGRAVLYYALQRLPEKEAAWELETARDEARDDFMNYLHNHRSFEEETVFYQAALATAKKGNGFFQLKQTG